MRVFLAFWASELRLLHESKESRYRSMESRREYGFPVQLERVVRTIVGVLKCG